MAQVLAVIVALFTLLSISSTCKTNEKKRDTYVGVARNVCKVPINADKDDKAQELAETILDEIQEELKKNPTRSKYTMKYTVLGGIVVYPPPGGTPSMVKTATNELMKLANERETTAIGVGVAYYGDKRVTVAITTDSLMLAIIKGIFPNLVLPMTGMRMAERILIKRDPYGKLISIGGESNQSLIGWGYSEIAIPSYEVLGVPEHYYLSPMAEHFAAQDILKVLTDALTEPQVLIGNPNNADIGKQYVLQGVAIRTMSEKFWCLFALFQRNADK